MIELYCHKLDPSSRLVRLMLGEYGIDHTLLETSAWVREKELIDIDPAAVLPVLNDEDMPPVIGLLAVIHHIEDNLTPPGVEHLVPATPVARSEMWRLIDWTTQKFSDEVSRYILEEKIGRRERRSGTPDPGALRAAKTNLTEHMAYFSYLFATRRWLGGDQLSLADLAFAAHLSALDYLGDVDWSHAGEVRNWYARIKSRPAFRPLLSERLAGMPASAHYADLDF